MRKFILTLLMTGIAVSSFAQGGIYIPALHRIYCEGAFMRGAPALQRIPAAAIGPDLMKAYKDYTTLPMKEFVAQYIVPSATLSAEIMKGMRNSLVGSYHYRRALNVQAKTQFLGEELSRRIVRRLVPEIELTKMDGYIRSFPKAMKRLDPETDLYTTLTRMQWTLEKLLRQPASAQSERRFSGAFLPNLETLEYASQFAFKATTLDEAFNKAVADGMAAKSGFFVIGEHPQTVGSTEEVHRLKDLYIMDLENGKWLSYNQSKSEAWKQILAAAPNGEYGAQVMPINSLYKREVETPIRVLDAEKVQVLSNDGETGIISTDALEQFQILGAKYTVYDSAFVPRKEPYYIYLETRGEPVPLSEDAAKVFGIKAIYLDYTVQFAAKKGYPLFNSIREVEYYLKQRNELKEPYLPLPEYIINSAF